MHNFCVGYNVFWLLIPASRSFLPRAVLIVTSKETLTYALFDCYVGKFDCFKLCLGFLVDENTVNTWMPCGVEAQKETIRLINIGLTIFHCIWFLR